MMVPLRGSLVWVCVWVWVGMGAGVSMDSLKALREFYNATNGGAWSGGSWIGQPCVNNWKGIGCNPSNTSITTLVLVNGSLVGFIPSSLGRLGSLQILNLGQNRLSGTIPESIGLLTNLTYLYLNDNQLIGSVPSTIVNLRSLNELSLANNQLSGTLPLLIGSLLNLRKLDLSKNLLSGTIPTIVANSSKLTTINLGSNLFSGLLPSFSNLPLQSLLLDNNKLCGGCVSLKTLNCNLSGFQFNCSCSTTICNISCSKNLTCPSLSPPESLQCSRGQLKGICIYKDSIISSDVLYNASFLNVTNSKLVINGDLSIASMSIINASVVIYGYLKMRDGVLKVNGNLTVKDDIDIDSATIEFRTLRSSITANGTGHLFNSVVDLEQDEPEGEFLLFSFNSTSVLNFTYHLIVHNHCDTLEIQQNTQILADIYHNECAPVNIGYIVGFTMGGLTILVIIFLSYYIIRRRKEKKAMKSLEVNDIEMAERKREF